ncbi:MAG TPA: hypothetical protein ENH92_03030, partial [Ectothiorhodospiraceae bacterium]|nr:hypothetical protein [Ectothiorhodospiraceae bacterium]
ANPETANIPIIFVTGMGQVRDEALGFKLGAVDYISKPISIPTVRARVSTHLALHSQNRKLEFQYQIKNLELIGKNAQLVQEIKEREKLENSLRESGESLRKLTDHLQSVREEEKADIAREIHDELGGTLTALKFDTAWLAKKLPSTEQTLLDKVNDMVRLVDASVATIRRIVTELRPTILDDLGLWAAIEWQVNEFSKRTGIKSSLNLKNNQYQPSQHQAISLFRVIQESLTNIVRHAAATQIEVGCSYDNNVVRLWIKDNGIGLPGNFTSRSTSHGIRGMYERIESLGGTINIEGVMDKGTTITIKLPT